MAHNIKIIQRAKDLGKTFRPGWGVIEESGRVHATTESEIFAALEWDYIEPADRH
jgi:DNA polymerase/3'-5' exonuclease PolX